MLRNKISGFVFLALAAVTFILYLPPLVMYGILNIGNITGFCIGALLLIWAVIQLVKGFSSGGPAKNSGLGPRLQRRYNSRMGRDTVIIQRGGMGHFSSDPNVIYDGKYSGSNLSGGIISRIVVIIICLILALAAVETYFIAGRMTYDNSYDNAADSSTVIVLGCGVRGETPTIMYRQRIEAARRYLLDHPDAKAVLSGGQGAGEDISEAQAAYEYLTDHEKAQSDLTYFIEASEAVNKNDINSDTQVPVIDAERLHLEDTSVSSHTNLSNSYYVAVQNALSTDAVIITQNYHEYRAVMTAEQAGFTNVRSYPAQTYWYMFATFYTRELYAILYYWIV